MANINSNPTFIVSTGTVKLPISASSEGAKFVKLQADGKIVVAGYSVTGNNFDLMLARYNPDGSLDGSFSGDGRLSADFGSSQDVVSGFLIQPDGKLLVAIKYGLLVRYNSDGSLDSAFGSGGKLTTSVGGVGLQELCLTAQPDGKILVGGIDYRGGLNGDFAVIRYNANGSLDNSFGQGGIVTTDINGTYDTPHGITLQPDGKILLAGYAYNGEHDFALVRYGTDGALDTTFSGDGKVLTDLGSRLDIAYDLAIQSDGKIIVAGSSGTNQEFVMVRYNSDGTLDLSFSDDGVVRENGRFSSSVLVQDDGKIIATGGSGLTRYLSDGSRDSSFYSAIVISSGNYYEAIALQSDGKIIAAGYGTTIADTDMIVTRFKEDGGVDKLFGLPVDTITGIVRYTENSQAVVLSSTVQIDDKELAASGSFAGATLTLRRQGGANVDDVFTNTGTLSLLRQGSFFAVDGVTIGRATINGEGALVLEFNTNASQSLVGRAMQQIAYSNSNDAPPSSVAIDWTFNDGNLGSQGTGGALSVTGTTTVTITAVNDAPYLASPVAAQRAAIGSTFQYPLPPGTFMDPDRDALSYSVIMADGTGVPPWLTFDRTTLTFSGTPSASDLGLIDLQIKATDTSGTSAFGSFNITVFRNSPPVSSGATTSSAEDTALSGILPTATDANGDTITYARASNPANGSVTVSANGKYTYTPDTNFNGTDSFTFTVSDSYGSFNTYTQTITVTSVNDAPVASASSLSVVEDIAATGTLAATDVDITTLTYSVVTQPAKGTVTLGANGAYTYTPAKDVNGSDSFTFKASDGALSSNTATVSITVAAVNDAPVVALPMPDQSTLAGSAFAYTFPSNAFTDVDSLSLTYSASLSTGAALPAWLSFNATTRTFSGTPGASNSGSIEVRVIASDGSLSVNDVFGITVSDRPVATSFQPADGSKAVSVGSNLLVTFNGPVERGAGAINLKTADGKVVETFTASNATVSGSTLTLNPTADLSIFTKYVVELGAGAVKDAAGNGNAADNRYDFQTATQDGLYHFFVVAFAAAPGATYMGQLAEAVNFGLPLNEIVEIFTTKKQFTDVYPTTMSNRELATQLVNNIVKNSASAATKTAAIDDIDAALGIGWSRGKMLYTVFGNLASKPLSDATWGNTAKQFQNQLAVARYFTEEMSVVTENLATLRGVIGSVTPDTDVSSVERIVQIIGTVPPGG